MYRSSTLAEASAQVCQSVGFSHLFLVILKYTLYVDSIDTSKYSIDTYIVPIGIYTRTQSSLV